MSDETNDEFEQIVWSDFADQIQTNLENLAKLEMGVQIARDNDDMAEIARISLEVSTIISRISWGAVPTVIMGAINIMNQERVVTGKVLQQVWCEARVVEEIVKVLAANETVDPAMVAALADSVSRAKYVVDNHALSGAVERT